MDGRFLVSACLFTMLAMVPDKAAATDRDPCGFVSVAANELSRVSDAETFRKTFPALIRKVASWFQKPYNEELSETEKGIYFTRQTGFTFMVDCQTPEKKRRIVRSGMFGVGFLLEPIAKRIFSSELYYYARTQHGLHVYVRDADLRRMRDGETYLFNRLTEPVAFCSSATSCGGPGRQFDLRFHYAIAHSRQDPAGKLTADFSPGCQVVEAAIYDGRKGAAASEFTKEDRSAAEWSNITASTCDGSEWNGLVAYNVEKAQQRLFSAPPVTGSYVHLASEGLRSAIPFILSRKMCEDSRTISTKNSLSLGGSINGKLSLLTVFEASGKAEKKLEFTDVNQRTLEAQHFYMFNSYGLSWGLQDDSELEDVEVVAKCEFGRPDTPTEVKLWFSDGGASYLVTLDIDELEKTAKETLKDKGAWRTDSTSRINGRFYIVAGVDQFHLWRQVIQGQVSAELRSVVANMTSVRRTQMIGLYTDLVMSIIFEYADASQAGDIKVDPI